MKVYMKNDMLKIMLFFITTVQELQIDGKYFKSLHLQGREKADFS